jgi:hypothetical protein
MLAGYRIAYEPAALTRHHHRRDIDSFGRQLYGYGVGVTAYYAALLRHRPSVLPALVRLVPAAARYLRGKDVTGPALPQDVPARFQRRIRRGMLTGPMAYIRSVRRQAQVAASQAPR